MVTGSRTDMLNVTHPHLEIIVLNDTYHHKHQQSTQWNLRDGPLSIPCHSLQDLKKTVRYTNLYLSEPNKMHNAKYYPLKLLGLAHEWFLPQWPITSCLCAQTVEKTLRSHSFLTIWCSQYMRYTRTEHFLCHSMFYDHTLAEIWMLREIYIITD